MFLDAISLIAKILAVIVVTIAGVTLLYLLVDFMCTDISFLLLKISKFIFMVQIILREST